ncbi:MAG: hypothetical protein LAN84_08480 [Acidobacteriia bacterium]|nr:hypothetical protein [Terriglobia bacterium]
MAVVQGIKEKVHLPIYDALKIEPTEQLRDTEKSSTLKFFVDVQGKTKLLTNLQSASLLPHYNTFEARAMRVVISDLPPEFPDKDKDVELDGLTVLSSADPPVTLSEDGAMAITVSRAVDLLREALDSNDGTTEVDANDEDVTLPTGVVNDGTVELTTDDLQSALDNMPEGPPQAQIEPNNGAGSILSKFIYNTVTTFYVGEKVMIEMPTWFFPAGAGPYAESGKFSTHGEPNPTATFRFAEPIFIDKQQNFRVEIEIPDSDVLDELQRIYGPLFVWVVLDGYMTRGVQ